MGIIYPGAYHAGDLLARGTAVALVTPNGEGVAVPLADFHEVPADPLALPAPQSPMEATGDRLRAILAEMG